MTIDESKIDYLENLIWNNIKELLYDAVLAKGGIVEFKVPKRFLISHEFTGEDVYCNVCYIDTNEDYKNEIMIYGFLELDNDQEIQYINEGCFTISGLMSLYELVRKLK